MLSATQIQTGLTLHNRFTINIPIVKQQTFPFRRQDQSILERTVNGIPGLHLQLTPLQPAIIPQRAAPKTPKTISSKHEQFYLQCCKSHHTSFNNSLT